MRTRLTDDQVRQIRDEFKGGRSQRELAETFGVRQNTVSSIVTGRTRQAAGGPISRGTAAKLSQADVIAMRAEAASGVPLRDLGEKFGVSVQMVSNVTTGRAFPDLPGPTAVRAPARARRLSAEQVSEIVKRSAAGEPRAALASAFGVSIWTIDSVRRRATQGTGGGAGASFSRHDVRAMRQKYQQGATQRELAADFDTSQQMVSNIVRGVMYASYGGPLSGNGRRRFKADQVQRIREAARVGLDSRSLAEQYDTTDVIIRQVIDGSTYPLKAATDLQ